jgi:hypothetical protein
MPKRQTYAQRANRRKRRGLKPESKDHLCNPLRVASNYSLLRKLCGNQSPFQREYFAPACAGGHSPLTP